MARGRRKSGEGSSYQDNRIISGGLKKKLHRASQQGVLLIASHGGTSVLVEEDERGVFSFPSRPSSGIGSHTLTCLPNWLGKEFGVDILVVDRAETWRDDSGVPWARRRVRCWSSSCTKKGWRFVPIRNLQPDRLKGGLFAVRTLQKLFPIQSVPLLLDRKESTPKEDLDRLIACEGVDWRISQALEEIMTRRLYWGQDDFLTETLQAYLSKHPQDIGTIAHDVSAYTGDHPVRSSLSQSFPGSFEKYDRIFA